MRYKIIIGFNHFKNSELFQVVGVNNEYVGEYHTTRNEAHKELIGL